MIVGSGRWLPSGKKRRWGRLDLAHFSSLLISLPLSSEKQVLCKVKIVLEMRLSKLHGRLFFSISDDFHKEDLFLKANNDTGNFYHVRPPLCSSEVEGEKVKEVDLLPCSPLNLGRKKEKKESGKVVLVIHSLGV